MVMRRNDLNEINPHYETLEEEYGEYDPGQKTAAMPTQIFIDKSQHTTNYININVTGQQSPELDIGHATARLTYIRESEISKKLLGVLDEIELSQEDPAVFEQELAKFLSALEELETRKPEREVCFSDLLSMLQMALVNVECYEMSKVAISVLKEAVKCLPHKITQETLQTFRNRFRKNGIDLLKPFKTNFDPKSILQEMYPDETAT